MATETTALSSSIIGQDTDRGRPDGLLFWIALTVLAPSLVMLVAAALTFEQLVMPVGILGAIVLLELVVLLLAYTERGRAAALAQTFGLWGLLTVFFAVLGGVNLPVFGTYAAIIVAAGLLLSGRTGVIVALMSVAAGLFMLAAGDRLPELAVETTPVVLWSIQTVNFLLVAAFIYVATQRIREALARRDDALSALQTARQRLEHEVDSRTGELQRANRALQLEITERTEAAEHLRTVAELSERLNAILDTEQLLEETVELLKDRFDLYHVHLYLLDEERRTLRVRAGSGDVGRTLREREHEIALAATKSLVARAARSQACVCADDVRGDPHFLPNPLLPETRSEVAVPLVSHGGLIGVLDIQDDTSGRFSETDIDVFETLAGQVAIALDNALLFEQQRAAEARVRQREEHFRSLLENASDIVTVVDRDGTVGYASPSTARVLGYQPDALDGRSLFDLVHPDDLTELTRQFTELAESPGVGNTIEFRLRHEDGRWRALEAVGNNRLDDPAVCGIIINARDITERQEAAAALHATQRRLDTLFANLPHVVLYETGGEEEWISENVRALLGYSPREFAADRNFFPQLIHPDDQPLVEEAAEEWWGRDREGVLNLEFRCRRADGSYVWLEDFMVHIPAEHVVTSSNGHTNGAEGTRALEGYVTGVLVDVTERKLTEAERERFTRQLRVAAEAAGRLSAILDPAQLLEETVELLRDRFDLYHVHVYLLDTDEDRLRVRAGSGRVGQTLVEEGHAIARDAERSLVARAAREQAITAVDDVSADPHFLPNPLLPETRSEVAVPLVAHGTLLGVLDVQDNAAARFSQADLDTFSTLAGQIAIALENAQLFERQKVAERERERFTQQLRLAADLAERLSAILDPAELVDETIRLLEEHFGLYYVHLFLLDDDGRLRVTSGSGRIGQALLDEGFSIDLTTEHSLVARAARERSVISADDVTEHEDYLAHPLLPETRSEVAVPLIARGEVLGVLDVQDRVRARFGPADLDTLSTLAGQVAVALDNAQLFEARRQSDQRSRALVQAVPDMMFEIAADGTYLEFYPSPTRQPHARPEEFIGRRIPDLMPPERAAPFMQAIEDALRTGKAQNIEFTMEGRPADDAADDRHADAPLTEYWEGRFVPAGDDRVIMITREFTDRVRAEEERERFTRQLRTAVETAERLSRVLDRDQLLDETVELLRDRFDLYHVHVYLTDASGTDLVMRAGSGEVGQALLEQAHHIPADTRRSLVARAAARRELIHVPDVSNEPDFMANPLLPDTRSEVAVPLIAGDELLGVLDVQDDQRRRFSRSDLDTLSILAGHTATAIDNARRFAAQQEAEQRARERERQLRLLAENTIDMISRHALDATYTYVTPASRAVVGLAPSELEGRDILSLVHPDDVESVRDAHEKVLSGRDPVVVTYRLKHTDGHWVWVESTARALRAQETGEVREIIVVTRDITERMAAEEERIRYTNLLRTAAETAERLSAILDPSELLEETVELLKERFDLYHVHFYLLDEESDELVVAAGSGEVGRTLHDRGHRIPLGTKQSLVARAAWTQQPVVAADVSDDPHFLPNPLLPETRSEVAVPLVAHGGLLGVLDVQDSRPERFTQADLDTFNTLAGQIAITLENARFFEEIQRTAERLRELDQLKSEFLANMSHELRTPLNSILGYAELILMGINGELSDETLEDVQAIYDNGQHLLNLINDVLDLAKIEAGQMTLDIGSIEVEPLLEEVRKANSGLLIRKPVEMIVEVEPELEPIEADRLRLQQILNNLVSNAVKFTNEGHIFLRARRDGGRLCIEVEDTGIGMSAEDVQTIFDKFRQVDGSFTRRAQGTGLGLAITQHLIEMHGGEIDVRSVPDEGTMFRVYLPLRQDETADGQMSAVTRATVQLDPPAAGAGDAAQPAGASDGHAASASAEGDAETRTSPRANGADPVSSGGDDANVADDEAPSGSTEEQETDEESS